MKYITSDHLKKVINDNTGEEMIISKYELVMLLAKRAKQIVEREVSEGNIDIIKPITMAIKDIEDDNVIIEKMEK